jgi:hypothetical protein
MPEAAGVVEEEGSWAKKRWKLRMGMGMRMGRRNVG